MADKLSSPSSSSNGATSAGSNQTPPGKLGTSSAQAEDNFLVIRRQPPTYAFSGEQFEFLVGLEVTKLTGNSPTGTEVELVTSLRIHRGYEDGHPSTEAANDMATLVLLNRGSNTVSTSKPCLIRCKIQMRQTIRRDSRTSLSLHVSTRDGTHRIAGTTTSPIQMVSYKLRVATDSTWTNIWYKDEGGRDKSMEAIAELYGNENTQHRERIPLRLTLFYVPPAEGREPIKVTNQDILRSLGSSSKLYTDKSTGKATIRFRIEDVSKNHQGQDFVLQIAPDYRKGFWDIAPGLTPAVSVRSKRNKRQRSGVSQSSRNERRGSSPSDSVTGSGPFEGSGRSVWGPEGLTATDPQRLREAMQGIVHWTEEVVNGLYPLQWHIIGYAQHPDGSADYSRPQYSMANPNALISRVLATYSESTRENLWILSQAVEQAVTGQGQASIRETYVHHSPDNSYSIPSVHRQPPPMQPAHAGGGRTPPGLMPPPQAAMGQIPMQGLPVQGGMHPAIASEAFRPKMHMGDHSHLQQQQQQHPHQQQQLPQQQQQHQQHHHLGPMSYASPAGRGRAHGYPPHGMQHPAYYRQLPTQARRGMDDPDSSLMPEPYPASTIRPVGLTGSPPDDDSNRLIRASFDHEDASNDPDSLESQVEYVLAKEYKALRTGDTLGFPAYSASKEILGFYKESASKVGEFIPISRHPRDFGPLELQKASDILSEAISKKSSEVHVLKEYGTISNLLNHALAYDWTKNIAPPGGPGNSHSGSEG